VDDWVFEFEHLYFHAFWESLFSVSFDMRSAFAPYEEEGPFF